MKAVSNGFENNQFLIDSKLFIDFDFQLLSLFMTWLETSVESIGFSVGLTARLCESLFGIHNTFEWVIDSNAKSVNKGNNSVWIKRQNIW